MNCFSIDILLLKLKTTRIFISPENFIERLWAYMLVNQMIKEHKAVENKWLSRSLKEEALKMALRYQFVTPLTAMIVTKPSSSSLTNQVLSMDDVSPYWNQEDVLHYTEGYQVEGFEEEMPNVLPVDNKLSEKRDLDDNGAREAVAGFRAEKMKATDLLKNSASPIFISMPLLWMAVFFYVWY